jgi:hypothetical protein
MPSSSTRIAGLLADLAKALTTLGTRWYLFGAQAAIIHGVARLTADVDVTVDLTNIPTAKVVEELQRRGFDPQFADSAFIETTRVIPLIHERSRMPVDLVLAGPGLEDLFFERAQRVRIGRTFIRVAAPEDLIAMKILSGRLKDLDDVEALLVARKGDIELATIRNTLRLAQKLLDQSDLVPTFERIVRLVPVKPRSAARRNAGNTGRTRTKPKRKGARDSN